MCRLAIFEHSRGPKWTGAGSKWTSTPLAVVQAIRTYSNLVAPPHCDESSPPGSEPPVAPAQKAPDRDYWHEMRISADGRYWGNAVSPESPLVVPRGRWQCLELMLKLNSAPGKADGEHCPCQVKTTFGFFQSSSYFRV